MPSNFWTPVRPFRFGERCLSDMHLVYVPVFELYSSLCSTNLLVFDISKTIAQAMLPSAICHLVFECVDLGHALPGCSIETITKQIVKRIIVYCRVCSGTNCNIGSYRFLAIQNGQYCPYVPSPFQRRFVFVKNPFLVAGHQCRRDCEKEQTTS